MGIVLSSEKKNIPISKDNFENTLVISGYTDNWHFFKDYDLNTLG